MENERIASLEAKVDALMDRIMQEFERDRNDRENARQEYREMHRDHYAKIADYGQKIALIENAAAATAKALEEHTKYHWRWIAFLGTAISVLTATASFISKIFHAGK